MRRTIKSVVEEANVNIERLIESLLERERVVIGGTCIDPESQYRNSCIHDCNKCRNTYFEKRKDQLRNSYYLKTE